MVEEEAVAAPGGTSTPPSSATVIPVEGQLKQCFDSTKRTRLGDEPHTVSSGKDRVETSTVDLKLDSTTTSESNPKAASPEVKMLLTTPSNGKGLLNATAKHKYKTTPHTKKAYSVSPSRSSNAFSTLSEPEKDVESLILKAQQSRKTIHPRRLGTSGREIEPGGCPKLTAPLDLS